MNIIKYPITDPESCVIVKRGSNGYSVSTFAETLDTAEIQEDTTFFESKKADNMKPDFDMLAGMLWHILDSFEEYNSKHYSDEIKIFVHKRPEYP